MVPASAEQMSPTPPAPSVIIGTDQFLNPGALDERPASGVSEGDVTLNFVDTDLREVVRSILGDILGENYLIDPAVTGTATLQTSSPLTRAALLPTLEAALRANGASLLLEDDLYKVVPAGGPGQGVLPLRGRVSSGIRSLGFGVQAVPLRYVAAREMAEVLQLFAPEGSVLKADATRNLLILSGSAADRRAFMDTIALFDVDWIAGMSFGLFPLRNAKADSMVGDLQAIFGQGNDTPVGDLIRFVPVTRLNAIIVISPRASYLERARAWIERLDQEVDGVRPQLYVYYVQNARAVELAEILGNVFDDSAVVAGVREQPVRPIRAAGSPQVSTSDLMPDATVAEALLQPSALTQEVVTGDAQQGGGDVSSAAIRVIADDKSNALLVLATPQDYRMVERAIRQLDIVPLQVLIEATIAEVTLTDDLRYGVQFFLDGGSNEFTLSNFVDGTVGQVFPGFSYLFQASSDVRVVLDALSSVTDVNIVSSPQLMVLDNQTAELQVGDQVPVATQSAVSVTNPDAPIVNSIEFRDTGVILRVTPRVNSGGLVVMEIQQEVSSVVNTTTSGIDSPTIQQRKINSAVAIQSGETVTLGGLISDSTERLRSGIPVLSDIPVLGALFGRRVENDVRTELIVLITPRVIENQIDAREVTEELRSRLRALQPLQNRLN